MLNYILLIGRITKITKPENVGGKNRPGKINITFDEVEQPNQTNFAQVTVWSSSLVEELEIFQAKNFLVIASCSLKGRIYYPKKSEEEFKQEQKGVYYFDVVLNSIGYFGEENKPLTGKELPKELFNDVWRHARSIHFLEKINWWNSDKWNNKIRPPRLGDLNPEETSQTELGGKSDPKATTEDVKPEKPKEKGDTLEDIEKFIKVVDSMELTPEDSDPKPEDSTPKTNNKDHNQDQNT